MKSNSAQEQKSQDISTFQMLLSYLEIPSLQEFNLILFNPTKNNEYYKQIYPRLKRSPNDISPLLQNSNYKQICEYYSCKQEFVSEAKNTIRQKYQELDIIRAHQHRKEMWLVMSKAKFRMEQEPNYYSVLKNMEYPEYFAKVIEADVKRTAQESSQEGLKKLSSILRCLTKRNPYIGYCQGMNFVVNFLIMMQFQEEECFWIAVELFQQILPKNYYTNMQGIAIDLKIIDAYLQIQRPQIHQVLTDLNISLSIFSLEWLVCLCSTILPYNVLMPLWDLLFAEGTSVLLKSIIVIIDQLSTHLFNCRDFNDFLLGLQPFKKRLLFEESTFLMKLHRVFIDKNLLNYARRIYGCLMHSQHRDCKKKPQIACDPKWPICHQQLQKNKIEQVDPDPWVIKQQGPPRIIENYLQLKTKNQKVLRQDTREQRKKVVIGRMPHTCQPQAYDLLRGDIQLNNYDSETNSYIPAVTAFNETSLQFLKSASVIDTTFVFNTPKS